MKTDIRIVKSKRAIRNAFYQLMKQEGFSKITVQQILNIAEINRSTFYSYYNDKFDLLDKLETELLDDLKQIIFESAPVNQFLAHKMTLNDLNSYIIMLLDYLHVNGEYIVLLMGPNGDNTLPNKLSTIMSDFLSESHLIDYLAIPKKYAISALVGMITNVIYEWVQSDFDKTPEELAEIIVKIEQAILHQFTISPELN